MIKKFDIGAFETNTEAYNVATLWREFITANQLNPNTKERRDRAVKFLCVLHRMFYNYQGENDE